MKGNMLQYLFQGYLKLLKRTMRIQWEENEVGREGQIFGFWHEDSFCMNLILEELALSAGPVNVIVTADRRGGLYSEYSGKLRRKSSQSARRKGFLSYVEIDTERSCKRGRVDRGGIGRSFGTQARTEETGFLFFRTDAKRIYRIYPGIFCLYPPLVALG